MAEQVEDVSTLPLPEAFLDFLRQNDLDPSIYDASHSTPRYIRLKPGCEIHLVEIEAEVKCKLKEVSWLRNFYYLSPDVRIASTKAYKEGKMYGIDAASGAAVLALGISQGDHVLDLCAAPGAKLCMILDLLGCSGTVTGVDASRHRLAACRTMLQKYTLGDHCRLFVADGTAFSLIPVRVCLNSKSSAAEEPLEVYKEWSSRRPWKERKQAAKTREKCASQLFSQIQDPELIFYGRHSGVVGLSKCEVYQSVNNQELLQFGYDKVLVDAECTHDGSIRHIQKFEQWGWTTLKHRLLDAERTDLLSVLQLKLLANGFRMLKIGGSLVYSTCSLTLAQNEDVVEQFLSQNSSAVFANTGASWCFINPESQTDESQYMPSSELLEIDAAQDWPCKSARIHKTLRFDPLTSSTSGLFIAKFTKLAI